MAAHRPLVRYFVCYAHDDAALKQDLLRRLQLRFGVAKHYHFEGWQDGDILPGEGWREEIERALQDCEVGLLLLSFSFLGSEFISTDELPFFVGPTAEKRAVPIALKHVPLDGSIEMRGLENLQLFRDEEGRSFAQLTTDSEKDAFADLLFERLLKIVEKYGVAVS